MRLKVSFAKESQMRQVAKKKQYKWNKAAEYTDREEREVIQITNQIRKHRCRMWKN